MNIFLNDRNINLYHNDGFGMKRIFLIILGSIIFVLIICSFIGPWYTLTEKGRYKYELPDGYEEYEEVIEIERYADYHLDEIKVGSKTSDIEGELSFNYKNNSDFSIFKNIKIIMIITIIFALLCLIFTIIMSLGIEKNIVNLRYITIIFFIFIVLLSFISTIYFAQNYEDATGINRTNIISGMGFWYQKTQNSITYSAGPGFGWYSSIIAGFLSFISLIIIVKYPNKKIEKIDLDLIHSYIDKRIDPNYHPCPKCREYIHLESTECPNCRIKFDSYRDSY